MTPSGYNLPSLLSFVPVSFFFLDARNLMNSRLFVWSLTAALAGFLFGFDTVVISGADKKIQALWMLDDTWHGLVIGMALWGTVLGSLLGAWPTDRFGRKNTLIAIGALYLSSAIWSAVATDEYQFMIARFIGGLGVGISTVTAPLYISEISPPGRRGRLAGMFQFNIVLGILVAYLSNTLINYVLGEGSDTAWRWMLGVEAFPALIYTLLTLTIPQSPRWLITKKGNRAAAEQVLAWVNPAASPQEISSLADEIQRSSGDNPSGQSGGPSGGQPFWRWGLRVPIALAFLVAMFNQLSGINAILYFAPRIFQLAGFGESSALLNSIGIGITNLLFTFAGLYLIDRIGRRSLLYLGSLGYIASLGICTWAFFAYAPSFQVANSAINLERSIEGLRRVENLPQPDSDDLQFWSEAVAAAKTDLTTSSTVTGFAGKPVTLDSQSSHVAAIESAQAALADARQQSYWGGMCVVLCIFAFIAAHAVGQGAVIWVLISEVFPNRDRAAGQSLGSFTHWIFAAGLTTIFPWLIRSFAPATVFGFFCLMMVLQWVWVAAMVPETKGVPLEEMKVKLGID